MKKVINVVLAIIGLLFLGESVYANSFNIQVIDGFEAVGKPVAGNVNLLGAHCFDTFIFELRVNEIEPPRRIELSADTIKDALTYDELVFALQIELFFFFILDDVDHGITITNVNTGTFTVDNLDGVPVTGQNITVSTRSGVLTFIGWGLSSGALPPESEHVIYRWSENPETIEALVASVKADSTEGSVPLKVNFTCAIDSGCPPYTCTWDFGDGATSTTLNPSHTYSHPGSYHAQVTIIDDSGQSVFKTLNIRVNETVTNETVCLTYNSPNATITTGETARIYGSANANHITLQKGAKAELFNFPGNNTITIHSDSSLFTVSRSGTLVSFEGMDGTLLKMPATNAVQTIVFNDMSVELMVQNKQVLLGSQELTLSGSPIVPVTTEGLDSVTVKDNENNTYEVTGVEESVDSIDVVPDGDKKTEEILLESEEKLTDGFMKIDFPDSANQGLRSKVEIKYNKVPTMIIAYDEEEEEYYALPFTVSADNTVILHIDSKDISILPVYDDSSTGERRRSSRTLSTAIYQKRFAIVKNDGETLEVIANVPGADYYEYLVNNNSTKEDLPFGGTISKYVSRSGVHTFKIFDRRPIHDLRVWKQDVFVQVSDDLAGMDIESIARKYAPILAYNDNEEYYPVTLEYLFNHDINEDIPFELPRTSVITSVPYSQIDEFMPYNGANSALIYYDHFTSKQKYRKGNADISNVYYSMLKGKDGNYYLNYHMLYAYDTKGGTSSRPGRFAHVFDRESMTLVFDGKPGTTTVPRGIIYGAHIDGQNLQLLEADDILGTTPYHSWEGPGIFVPWNNAYKYKEQPVVAVAKGSHALYPVCGTYEMTNWSSEPAGGSDEFSSDAEWNRLLVPPNLVGNQDTYSLNSLNLGRITSLSENRYLAFSGSWVDLVGWTNAKFPPFTDREINPEAWYSEADIWDIDHCKLPRYSKELMEDLFVFLTDNYGGCTDPVCDKYYPGNECGAEEYETIWFIPNSTSYTNRVPASQIRYKFADEFADQYYSYASSQLFLISELAKENISEIDAQYQFLNMIIECVKAVLDLKALKNMSSSEITNFLNNADFMKVQMNNLKRMGIISSDASKDSYVFQEMVMLVGNLYLEILDAYPEGLYFDLDKIELTKKVNAAGTVAFYISLGADLASIGNSIFHAVELTSVSDVLNSYLIAYDFIKANVCFDRKNSVMAEIFNGDAEPKSCDFIRSEEFIRTTYNDSGMIFPGVNAFYANGKSIKYTTDGIFDLFTKIPNKIGNYSYAEWYNSALDWTDYMIFHYNSFDPDLASSVIESYFAANNSTMYSIIILDQDGSPVPAESYDDMNTEKPIKITTPFHVKQGSTEELLAYDFHYSTENISIYRVNDDRSEELITGTGKFGIKVFNPVTLSPGENVFKESIELAIDNGPFENDEENTITINRYFYITASQSEPLLVYYPDEDGDGYGDFHSPLEAPSQPPGYVTDNTDCDDADPNVHPGAVEIPGDGIDQDCSCGDLPGFSGDEFTNSLNMTFVRIEPGTFMMGSPKDEPGRSYNETEHPVTLTQGYYMQTTEVTQGQWKAVMGSNPSHFSSCGDDCPVEKVSWNDIHEFIARMNQHGEGVYALPTEAQWEYAARAGSPTAFANGDITGNGFGIDPNLDAMGWYNGNSGHTTHPVGQKRANDWGLYDMHGNVYEWCQDLYWSSYYSSDAVTDPEGPATGVMDHVCRGGSWFSAVRSCRSADRGHYGTGLSPSSTHGFRLVLFPRQQ